MAQKTTEQLKAEIALLRKENEEAKGMLKEQAAELRVAQAYRGSNAKPIASLEGGVKVLVNHAVVHRLENADGSKAILRLSAQELANRPDICKQLLESGSSAVTLAKV